MAIYEKVVETTKIQASRDAVDIYRESHHILHENGGTPVDHTPLLERLVADLEKLGIMSSETSFEPKKTEILRLFWEASDEQNVKELGFINKQDFDEKATKTDREALELKWR